MRPLLRTSELLATLGRGLARTAALPPRERIGETVPGEVVRTRVLPRGAERAGL